MMIRWIVLICCLIPLSANAGWEVAQQTEKPQETLAQAQPLPSTSVIPDDIGTNVFPSKPGSRLSTIYAVVISGSLKENLERIMEQYHWKVVWNVPSDYNFDGRVTGSSLPTVLEKLLQPFPLQAVMYTANRTITIEARKPQESSFG